MSYSLSAAISEWLRLVRLASAPARPPHGQPSHEPLQWTSGIQHSHAEVASRHPRCMCGVSPGWAAESRPNRVHCEHRGHGFRIAPALVRAQHTAGARVGAGCSAASQLVAEGGCLCKAEVEALTRERVHGVRRVPACDTASVTSSPAWSPRHPSLRTR